MTEKEKGVLEIYTEKEWYGKKFSKSSDEPDTGTEETCERASQKGIDRGAGEQYERERSASADIATKRS